MGEELQTQTATLDTGKGDIEQETKVPETVAKETELPEKSDVQPQPESGGQVEPSHQTNSSGEIRRKPSDYIRLRRERNEAIQKAKELESLLQQQNKTSDSKSTVREYTDDEIFSMGLGKFSQKLRDEAIELAYERLKKEFPNHMSEYQNQIKREQETQELKQRYDKLHDENKYDLFMDTLKEHPELDYFANKDPLLAFDRVMDIVNKKAVATQDPLASKKSRMGIVGSSTPMNGGNVKPTLERLRAEKAKLQDQFSKSFNDPVFMKKWEENTQAIAKLVAQE